ncbi:MAG: hypothetical protein J7L80_02925, partial [Thermoplasmata archaeon]|nr:hypothetical protein [Thermoplasmata archaeon]
KNSIAIGTDWIKRKFLLKDKEEDVKLPNINFTAKAIFSYSSAKKLIKILRVAINISDMILLAVEKNKLRIITKDNEDKVEGKIYAVTKGEDYSYYPLEDYIEPIMHRVYNVMKAFETKYIQINLRRKYPCEIETGGVRYMVAPRLEEV